MLPLALIALQNPLARAISFDEPAMPLGRLLPALGAKAGVEIKAVGGVAKDVALVRVRDKPLGEILRRIAEEDGVELEATKTGFRLVRTVASERKERKAALERRIESLKPALDASAESLRQPADEAAYRRLLPTLKAAHDKGGAWVRSGSIGPTTRTPLVRAAMRVALLVPRGVLADLKEGDSVVYSNRPTRLQATIAGLEGVMSAYVGEQNAWAAANLRSEPVRPSNNAADPFRHVDPVDAAPVRIVAKVWRTNSSDAALVRIVLLDAEGNDLGMADYGLTSKEAQKGISEFLKPTEEAAVSTSRDTADLIAGVPALDGSGPAKATAAAVALLTQPENRDPLSFAATDLVRDMAGDRAVVAVLPDPVWLCGFVRKGGLMRSDRALLGTFAAAREAGGWLLIHPLEPETARRNRVDRIALGRFVRAIVEAKRVPLDAYAEYAWTASDAPSDLVGVFEAMMIAPGVFNPDVDWRVLRLFGSLSVTDRKALLAGGKKTWATLSEAQRTLASWVVTHSVRSLSNIPEERARSTTLLFEPTEIYAQGFDGLEVALNARDDAPLLCESTTDPNARHWQRVLKPTSAGNEMGQANGPQFDRFGIARRTTYGLVLSARKGVSAGAELEDVVPPETLKPLREMPDAIREAVERAKTEAERRQEP